MSSSEKEVISAIRRLKESQVSQHNQHLILEYDKKLSGNLVGFARRKKFIDTLRWWALDLKMDFNEATVEQIRASYERLKATIYAPATKNRYITMLRQYFKHLEGDDEFFPPKVRKLKQLPHQQELVSEHGETKIRIFKVSELEAMIKAARTPRDKCAIALTYDSGGRRDEVCSLLMRNVKRKPPFMHVFLHGDKTKKHARVGSRWVPLYYSIPYIEEYLKMHPYKLDEDDKPFWVNNGNKKANTDRKLTDGPFGAIFYRAMKNANVKSRRIQDLRHTKYTHLGRLGMKEAPRKRFMGWSPNSKQPGRYEHLIDEDTVEEVARMYGLPYQRKDNDDIPIPIKCRKCDVINSVASDYCSNCNSPLSPKALINAESREKYLRQQMKKKELEMTSRLSELEKQVAGLFKEKVKHKMNVVKKG